MPKPKQTEKAREESLPLLKMIATKAPVKSKMEKDFSPEEIEEIKTRAEKVEEGKEEEEKAANSAEDEKKRREKIIKIKKTAKELEKGNKEKIILFPSYSRNKTDTEWYKMGGFSALYYVYRMADRMGRKPNLMKDTDKFAKMDGIASVRFIDKFLASAMKLSEFDRYEQTEDGFYFLYLKKPLTDEEVGILRRTNESRHEMMHNVLKPKQADTAVYQAILMLDRQMLPRVSKMEKGYYMTVGDAMAKYILGLTTIYFKYANGYIDKETAKTKLLETIEGLLAGVALLGELDVWGYDAATSIGENINNLKRLVSEMK